LLAFNLIERNEVMSIVSSVYPPRSRGEFPEDAQGSAAICLAEVQKSGDHECWIAELKAPILLANPAESQHELRELPQPQKHRFLLETVVKRFYLGKLALIEQGSSSAVPLA
jgi:hypothetical protein